MAALDVLAPSSKFQHVHLSPGPFHLDTCLLGGEHLRGTSAPQSHRIISPKLTVYVPASSDVSRSMNLSSLTKSEVCCGYERYIKIPVKLQT